MLKKTQRKTIHIDYLYNVQNGERSETFMIVKMMQRND